ncbi:MAG: Gfo/Idh/MocA family oxidoreductase [Thermodesulfobacteriota bacterium]
MGRLKVAVIGCGYLGKFHAEKYAAMDDVILAGVADVNKDAAESVAQRLGTVAYTDYRQLLGAVDAVSIVVPTIDHCRVGLDFLESGVDIMMEKPMTATLAETDLLLSLAEKKKKIIQVGHLERFNPAVHPLKDIVDRPQYIEAHRLSIYKERGTDVSVVLDLMIHDIDIILNLVGSEIVDIRAAGLAIISDHVDIANARLEFANGCVATITASRVSNRSERRLRVFQENAYISLDFANCGITVVSRNEAGNGNGPVPHMNTQQLAFEKWDALEQELKSFVDCVRSRRTPVVSGREGREALRTALAVMDQIQQTGKRFE